MTRPLYIALLELKLFLNNRAELAFSIALPILLFALMYGALSSDSEVFTPASVVDLDGGPHARELVRRLDSLAAVDVEERAGADADAALERSAILFAVVIPDGFSEALEAGEPVPLVFRQRGNGGDTGQIVAAIVRGIARDMATDARVRVQVQRALAGSDVPQECISAEAGAQLASLRASPPVAVEVLRSGQDPEAESEADLFSRLLPGLIVMFVMFSVTLAAQALVEERRIGTLERVDDHAAGGQPALRGQVPVRVGAGDVSDGGDAVVGLCRIPSRVARLSLWSCWPLPCWQRRLSPACRWSSERLPAPATRRRGLPCSSRC